MLYYYAIIALHCIELCRVNVYLFLVWLGSTGVPGTVLRRNSNRPKLTLTGSGPIDTKMGPSWPQMSISSKTPLGQARQHPYSPVWTLGQVRNSKIVGDKVCVAQINTSAGTQHIYCGTYRRDRGLRDTSRQISFEFRFIKTRPPHILDIGFRRGIEWRNRIRYVICQGGKFW